MARYKHIDTSPRLIAVDLERQLLPGTFEHALNYLVDHELDLSRFDVRYKNDLTGASAYPPAMLLKVVLFPCNAGFGLWRTQRYLPATANTAFGFVLAIASKVRAAPLGCLRPCSQPCKVRTDTPMSAANWDWDRPVFFRASMTGEETT